MQWKEAKNGAFSVKSMYKVLEFVETTKREFEERIPCVVFH